MTFTRRLDLAEDALPPIDLDWIEADAEDPELRSAVQQDALALSDILVMQLRRCDVVVLSTPIYNGSIPASVKLWIDQVGRDKVIERGTASEEPAPGEPRLAFICLAVRDAEAATPAVETYLVKVFQALGFSDVTVLVANQTPFNVRDLDAAAKKLSVRMGHRLA